MPDFTLEDKQSWAERSARDKATEEHFFDENQPHYPLGFSVHYRNPGHWDVYARQCKGKVQAFYATNGEGSWTTAADGDKERAFCIRGEPGDVFVRDERWDPHRPHPREDNLSFKSVMAAMLWIADELMQEPTCDK